MSSSITISRRFNCRQEDDSGTTEISSLTMIGFDVDPHAREEIEKAKRR
jgi:hypothetical protein